MVVLGIESSCDETACAVVCDSKDISSRMLSNVVFSQIAEHQKYGGVIPEIAARSHISNIDIVFEKALTDAGCSIDDIDVIAATGGPGLIGGLLVGSLFGKAVALAANKKFISINHLEAHLLTCRLVEEIEFPFLTVMTSGGNFLFAEILGVGRYNVLGSTLDDAAGEAFDKVAKMLGLPYPGGVSIQNASMAGDENRFDFPMPLKKRAGCDVSFSGLKTAAKRYIEENVIDDQFVCDLAASFQNIVAKFIIRQLSKAAAMANHNVKRIVVSGGVAANLKLRQSLEEFCISQGIDCYAPPVKLCGDNGAMIAWAAIERINAGLGYSELDAKISPRWSI